MLGYIYIIYIHYTKEIQCSSQSIVNKHAK